MGLPRRVLLLLHHAQVRRPIESRRNFLAEFAQPPPQTTDTLRYPLTGFSRRRRPDDRSGAEGINHGERRKEGEDL